MSRSKVYREFGTSEKGSFREFRGLGTEIFRVCVTGWYESKFVSNHVLVISLLRIIAKIKIAITKIILLFHVDLFLILITSRY